MLLQTKITLYSRQRNIQPVEYTVIFIFVPQTSLKQPANKQVLRGIPPKARQAGLV